MKIHRIFYCLLFALVLLGISASQLKPTPVLAETPDSDQPYQPQEEVDNCLVCHSDKDALVSTAKAEETVESENEGEG